MEESRFVVAFPQLGEKRAMDGEEGREDRAATLHGARIKEGNSAKQNRA